MTEHTPGPWKVIDGRPGAATKYVSPQAGGSPLAKVYGAGVYNEYQLAENAALIAAAPDMLAALESMVGWIDHKGVAGPVGITSQMRAAISKAKGERP